MDGDIRAVDADSDFMQPAVSCDSDTIRRRVGYFVRTSLEVLGESYIWLAEKTGLSKRTLNDYGLGRRIPSDENIRKVAIALDAPYQTVEDLVNDPFLAGV